MTRKESDTGRTQWDLFREVIRGLSWSRVTSVLITAVLLLPVLKLYVLWLPELFSRGALRQQGGESMMGSHSFLLPSTALWVDSGLDVAPDDKLVIRVSGAVNLAAHRLVWSSLADTRPSMDWITYPGQAPTGDQVDPARNEGALYTGAPLGVVLMYVCENGPGPTAEDPRPPKDRVFSVVTESLSAPWIRDPVGKGGRLYFSVNDVIPDQQAYFTGDENYTELAQTLGEWHSRFVGGTGVDLTADNVREVGEFYGHWFGWDPPDGNAIRDRVQVRWEELRKTPRALHRLFYDDNAGAYLVTVGITRGSGG